jgi:MFS family permease
MGGLASSKILSVANERTGRCRCDQKNKGSRRPNAILNIYCARALRDFGDGFVAVLLPVYLTALGFSPFQVGVIATLALFGSAVLTLLVGLVGSRYEHRRLLLAAANLMVATGVAFALVAFSPFLRWSPSPARSTHRRAASACSSPSSTPY